MEPDQLIQQKEWPELSIEDREALGEIASDEQEFNMLKKMLLIAAGEEVPTLDEGVKVRLNDRLRKPGSVRKIAPWYYAAAAMLLLAVLTWVLVQRRPDTPETASIDPPHKDTTRIVTTPVPPVTKDTLEIAPGKKSYPERKLAKQKLLPKVQPDKSTFAVNATVGDNAALLGLITSVY